LCCTADTMCNFFFIFTPIRRNSYLIIVTFGCPNCTKQRNSAHCESACILTKTTNKMQLCRLIYYSLSALHVSGDVFAHHPEHLTVFTVSVNIPQCRCRLVSWMRWNCSSNTSMTSTGSDIGEY